MQASFLSGYTVLPHSPALVMEDDHSYRFLLILIFSTVKHLESDTGWVRGAGHSGEGREICDKSEGICLPEIPHPPESKNSKRNIELS